MARVERQRRSLKPRIDNMPTGKGETSRGGGGGSENVNVGYTLLPFLFRLVSNVLIKITNYYIPFGKIAVNILIRSFLYSFG